MQYLNPEDLGTAYLDAQSTARRSWTKYDEFERLAANEVRTDLPPNMPKVNDGTLSAAIRRVPKRVVAQPLTGKITATDRDEDWVAKLASVIWEKNIIPNANTDAPFLNKWQTALKNSLVYGSQPIYTFFTQHGTYTGADMSVPYVRNCYLEPGKVSDLASDFTFMDSWYTKLQAKRLVDKAIADAQSVKDGDLDDEDVMWDAKKLSDWYNAGPSGKDSMNMNAREREGLNRNEKGFYKLTSCFNRGYQAPFYTFAPGNSNDVCGTQSNTNPTGDMPLIWMYADEDLINPYGTGLIQLAGSNQNILDYMTQTDMLATQIGSQPPIKIGGDRSSTNLKSMVYAPSQFWFTGNAVVEPVTTINPAMYNAMPSRFSLYKSQQQSLTGTFDNTVSSEAGNPGFSKTSQGVTALQATTNADDTFVQQRLGEAYQRVAKSMVNIHMNNMEGSELLKLEGDQLEFLATSDLVPTDEDGNPNASEIEVVWNNVRGTFDFTVDPTSGTKSDDQAQVQNIQQAISEISLPVSYYMAQDGWKFNIGEAYRSVFTKLNIDNIDKILVKMTPEEKKAAQTAPFPIIDPPVLRVTDIPEEYIAGVMQNAGVQAGQPTAASVKDQAAMITAQAAAGKAQAEASATALTSVVGAHKTVADMQNQQVQQDQAAQAQSFSQNQAVQQQQAEQQQANPESGQPVQEGQQAAAQFANPNPPQPQPPQPQPQPQPQQPDPSQQPAAPQPSTNPLQRMMQIQQQYECDSETAAGIMAAQDHGINPQQYLDFVAQGAEQ